MKHTSVPAIIESEIASAINIPGLQHIRTRLITYPAEDGTIDAAGMIDFCIAGKPCDVSLSIKADASAVLYLPNGACSISWTADEVQPEIVKSAVIDALRAVVRAAA